MVIYQKLLNERKELLKALEINESKLKKLDYELGRYHIPIGNYLNTIK